MAPIIQHDTKHVPAWKKLGLKLKYAKEEPEDISGNNIAAPEGKKRKNQAEGVFAVDSTNADRPVKKPKKLKLKREDSLAAFNGDPTIARSPELEQPAPSTIGNVPKNKRKSVAFSPDTKIEDGDSAKQLFKTWHSGWVAEDPSFDPSTASPALRLITPKPAAISTSSTEEITTSSPSTSKPQKKSSKKSKRTKAKPQNLPASKPTDKPTEHPALTYLQTHHTSHEAWKFSKPHQNYLLKHLFSLTHIPSTHDPALLSYLRGLKGKSARSRIRGQALAIRSEDAEWLASEALEDAKMDTEAHAKDAERRRRDYEAAVARVKERLRAKEDEREEREWEILGAKEEWEWKLRKRRRAEVVLWGVGEEEDPETMVTLLQPTKLVNSEGAAQVEKARSKGMGGVEEISGAGIARGSQAKKIIFGDDGPAQMNGVHMLDRTQKMNGVQRMNGTQKTVGIPIANEAQVKRKRKRKRRTTGVPDDESSSSSSSSSSDESEDGEVGEQQAKGIQELSDGETSGPLSISTSDSESGSSSDDDDDCDENYDSDSG